MPAPSLSYASRSSATGLDPTTLSDDEDDAASTTSHSTWSSSAAGVVLGFVDGLVPSSSSDELHDWKMSRIGGEPTFPPFNSAPPTSSASCPCCAEPMPLLVQIYCPLESSSYERIVYAFACLRASCRGKQSCVRAWRAGVKWIDPEAEKRKEIEVKREEEDRQRKAKEVKVDLGSLIFGGGPAASGGTASNPFAPASSAASNKAVNPFAPAPAPVTPPAEKEKKPVSSPSLRAQPVPTPASHSWPSRSCFPAQYLTTSYEPTSSTSTSKPPTSTAALDNAFSDLALGEPSSSHREGKGAGGRTKKGSGGGAGRAGGSDATSAGAGAGAGAGEAYEVQKIKGVDEIFLNFQERVSREPEQIVRYEFSGEPLPFSAKSIPYQKIYEPTPDGVGSYSSGRRVPSCLSCGGRSVFEYQLMPNFVNILNRSQTDEGYEWASVWVFTCASECVNETTEQAWREERVFVEWEEGA